MTQTNTTIIETAVISASHVSDKTNLTVWSIPNLDDPDTVVEVTLSKRQTQELIHDLVNSLIGIDLCKGE